ncbi:hypothetical protein MKEN_00246300 [Mycena kentingensis (nom. inval.)]|nr:hypothetical protein MKEN_00246300 [Mycena kentingensis (nom. inval.)]
MVFALASLLLFSSALSTVWGLPALARRATGTGATINDLLPVPNLDGLKKWTTVVGAQDALPVSDQTLNTDKTSDHEYGPAPDGVQALQAFYRQGSFKPSGPIRGGFGFYAKGPEDVDLTTAKEALFGYSVMFPKDFEPVKGGKLPGLYGGDNEEVARGCSGGRRDTRCFSMRLMWRTNLQGELYTYLPDPANAAFKANAAMCDLPNSHCNPTFGNSLERGAFSFTPGQWTTVSERVKLNTVGQSDGELELFVGGKSVIKVENLAIRDSNEGRIRGMQMETFFGGSDDTWATPKSQTVFFADMSVAILQKL